MIFLSLGNKAIKGKRINNALGELNDKLNGFACTLNSGQESFEFVPRVSERHYREGYEFFLVKGKRYYKLRVVPFNPDLSYKEICIIPYDERKETTELFCDDIDSQTILTLCSLLVKKLLEKLNII